MIPFPPGGGYGAGIGGGGLGGSGYGGYGGYGGKCFTKMKSNKWINIKLILFTWGNGGLQSYGGYTNNNYGGQRNLGFGYYRGTDSYGFGPSREMNYYSGTGYRGYNWNFRIQLNV